MRSTHDHEDRVRFWLTYIWRWKGEGVEIGDVNFHKKSCCDEQFAPKMEGEQTSEYTTECVLF